MNFEISRARDDTPGCENVLHFNNAGAALPPRCVLDAQVEHLRRESEIGGYEAAAEAEDRIAHTYDAISRMLGCAPEEVAVLENATRAWDMVFYAMNFEAEDRILTSPASYASNYIAMLQVRRQTGVSIEVVPRDESGQISLSELDAMLDEDVKLISLTHVPTNGGLVNPADEVGALAHDADVPVLLDACQSAGQMPLNVDTLKCTMLTATGRKFLRGPRGTGFLYVQKDWIERLDPPFLDLHAAEWVAPDRYEVQPDARRFETWESNVAGAIGLATAVDYAMEWGLGTILERVQRLASELRHKLSSIRDVTVHDVGRRKSGITTFTVGTMGAEDIQRALRKRNVNTSVSPPRHTRLDAEDRDLSPMVRASVHYYNTSAEIDCFCETLQAVLDARGAV